MLGDGARGGHLRSRRQWAQCVGEIEAFCVDHDLDCDFVHQGWLWTATSGNGIRPPQLPPEPIRYLARRLIRAAVVHKEAVEDRGERPGRLAHRLAALAPAGTVEQTKRP